MSSKICKFFEKRLELKVDEQKEASFLYPALPALHSCDLVVFLDLFTLPISYVSYCFLKGKHY